MEAEWNEKLQLLDKAQKAYNEQEQKKEQVLASEQKQQILALATDFPKIWNSPNANHRDRKRIMRLLIEDITLNQNTHITVQIRFKGGMTKTLTIPLPQKGFATSPDIIEKIDHLIDDNTDAQIAEFLNHQGYRSGKGGLFSTSIIKHIRHEHKLKSRRQRLREKGYLTAEEIAPLLGLSTKTIHGWRRQGRIQGYAYNDRKDYLYEPINESQMNVLKQAKWSHVGSH